ncbi:MAG TPA: hypothetical protein VMH78_02905 [Thermoplasmata archaeon]|nr:hypothetical protein [Thermoplasmata archaeon]
MTPEEQRHGSRTAKLPLGVGATLGLGLIAFLVLAAPMAAAAGTAFTAPYMTATAVQSGNAIVSPHGASVSVLVPPTVSLMTGAVRASVLATATTTTVAPRPASVVYTAHVGVSGLAYTPSATGPAVLAASWIVGFQAGLAITSGAPGGGLGAVTVSVAATSYLVEQTTGLVVPGSQMTVVLFQKGLTMGSYALAHPPAPVALNAAPVVLAGGTTYLLTSYVSITIVVQTIGAVHTTTTATGWCQLGGPLASSLVALTIG